MRYFVFVWDDEDSSTSSIWETFRGQFASQKEAKEKAQSVLDSTFTWAAEIVDITTLKVVERYKNGKWEVPV